MYESKQQEIGGAGAEAYLQGVSLSIWACATSTVLNSVLNCPGTWVFLLWLLSTGKCGTCVAAQQPLSWAAGSKGSVLCCEAQPREEPMGLGRRTCTFLAGWIRPVALTVSVRGGKSHVSFKGRWVLFGMTMPQSFPAFRSHLCFSSPATGADTSMNQYSLVQLPVAGVNGKEWQEWEVGELLFGSSWWFYWLMEPQHMTLSAHRL